MRGWPLALIVHLSIGPLDFVFTHASLRLAASNCGHRSPMLREALRTCISVPNCQSVIAMCPGQDVRHLE